MPISMNQVAQMVVPQQFSKYIQQQSQIKSRLITSGAIVAKQELSNLLAASTGGLTFTIPSFKDLDDDAERISTDTLPIEYTGGTANPDPAGIGTASEVAVGLRRNFSWGSTVLAADLAGEDPMGAISSRIVNYWLRRKQASLIAMTKGIFADNDAAPAGSEHVQGDLTYDASGSSFANNVTNFTQENLGLALLTMGDSQDQLSMMMVHSVVANRIRNLNSNSVVTTPASEMSPEVTRWGNIMIITDDSLPNTGGVYESWLFGAGAFAYGEAPDPEANEEVVRHAGAGNGGGASVLYSRRKWCLHPIGHAYKGTPANGGPSNLATTNNLANAGSWQRVYTERKQIKIARLKTREA